MFAKDSWRGTSLPESLRNETRKKSLLAQIFEFDLQLFGNPVTLAAGESTTIEGVTYTNTSTGGQTIIVASDGTVTAEDGARYTIALDAGKMVTVGANTYKNMSADKTATLSAAIVNDATVVKLVSGDVLVPADGLFSVYDAMSGGDGHYKNATVDSDKPVAAVVSVTPADHPVQPTEPARFTFGPGVALSYMDGGTPAVTVKNTSSKAEQTITLVGGNGEVYNRNSEATFEVTIAAYKRCRRENSIRRHEGDEGEADRGHNLGQRCGRGNRHDRRCRDQEYR